MAKSSVGKVVWFTDSWKVIRDNKSRISWQSNTPQDTYKENADWTFSRVITHDWSDYSLDISTPVLKTKNEDWSVSTRWWVRLSWLEARPNWWFIIPSETRESSFAASEPTPSRSRTWDLNYWGTYSRWSSDWSWSRKSWSSRYDEEYDNITEQLQAQQTQLPAVGSDADILRRKEEKASEAIEWELQWIQRVGQLFDRQQENYDRDFSRSQENLQLSKERADQDREFRMQQYTENVNRDLEDVRKQKEQTLSRMRKLWGVLWANVTSSFYDNYQDVADKYTKVVDRIFSDLNTFEERDQLESSRLMEDYKRSSEQLLQDYQYATKRHKEDFEYQMRDYRENAIMSANALVEKYGLDWEQLWQRLQELSFDAFNKVQQSYDSYVGTMQKETDLLQDQYQDIFTQRELMREDQRATIDEFLAWSANRTLVELNAMVANGQISEQAANMALSEIVQNSIDTLDANFAPWVGALFQDQIINAINAGKTPNQALQEVIQSPEFKESIKELAENDPLFQYKIRQQQLQAQKLQQDINETTRETEWEYADLNVWYVEWIGTGNVTAYGTDANPFWLDIDWIDGVSDIVSPIDSKVVDKWTDPDGYGNYITLEDESGNRIRYAHLSDNGFNDINVWMSVWAGIPFAKVGKTGNVISMWSDGSHVDITLRGSDWVKRTAKQVEQYLNSWWASLWGMMSGLWPVSSIWVPISYERWVKNLVPATLMNSEVELKELNAVIKSMYDSWMDAEDATLMFMWFDVQDPDNKSLATSLVDSLRTAWADINPQAVKTISDFINKWNYAWAINRTENEVTNYIKDIEWQDFISESVIKAWIKKAQWLSEFIDWLDSSPIGVVEGNMEKRLRRLKSEDAQKIQTLLTEISIPKISWSAGADMTEAEVALFDPLIPNLGDTPDNFANKLNRLLEEPMLMLNSQRTTYWMPEITQEMVINNNKELRKEAYMPQEEIFSGINGSVWDDEMNQAIAHAKKEYKRDTNEY